MSSFQELLAQQSALTSQQPAQASSSSTPAPTMSIRGQGRLAGQALRQAGVLSGAANGGMDVDGGRPHRGGATRIKARNAGNPLDQTGRHRPGSAPYGRPPNGIAPPDPRGGRNAEPHGARSLIDRMRPRAKTNLNTHPSRNPAGTPPVLKDLKSKEASDASFSKLKSQLGGEEMKQWIQSKHNGSGFIDLSSLPNDPWLKAQGILHLGHRDAPSQVGAVFWSLLDKHIQRPPNNIPIHTISLANNDLHHLAQLGKMPAHLRHLRAVDLSGNPIRDISELDELMAKSERKGKANAGYGGLKSLTELKMDGCNFREKVLAKPNGAETYQHEILRRFPGLLILDGTPLNRIVFPIPRQPKVSRDDDERVSLAAKPFTFPLDVQGAFVDNQQFSDTVNAFCARFFQFFDTDRPQLYPAYAPRATISITTNRLISRSAIAKDLARPGNARSNWNEWGPGRNLLRTTNAVDRVRSLKSPMDELELKRWWNKDVPKTKHDLTDASKWLVDWWVLDGEGMSTRLCISIQGLFEEMPYGSDRSFSRTFVVGAAADGSTARNSGWDVVVLSDTMVVTHYLSTQAFDERTRSVAIGGVTIFTPTPQATALPLPAVDTTATPEQQAAIMNEVRSRTRMNEQFATMCCAQNGWDLQRALQNFEEIKATIPAEAYV